MDYSSSHPLPVQEPRLCTIKEEHQKVKEDTESVTEYCRKEHLGIVETITRIIKNCYWPGMYRDITEYDNVRLVNDTRSISGKYLGRCNRPQ